MRDAYFERLVVLLKKRLQEAEGKDIVVSQGAYKRKHRQFLAEQIPNLRMIWVDAPVPTWEARINNRQGGISLASARALQPDFEPPSMPHAREERLVNDADFAYVLEQFKTLLSRGQRDG